MKRPTDRIRTLAVALIVGIVCAAFGWPAAKDAASATRSKLFIPTIMRPATPLGMITTPGELRATKAQADRGSEPSRSAVKTLLEKADEALDDAPCADALYASSADANCLNMSAEDAFVLALAFHMTGDTRYSDHAAALIRAWPTTLTQIDQSDDQVQLDWSRFAPALIWAADLLDGTPSWDAADRQRFEHMLTTLVLPLGQQAANRNNNWADAGNLLRLSIAVYAKLPDEQRAAIASWKLKLDGVRQSNGEWQYGMLADGSLAEENRRAEQGLSYNQAALSLKTVFAEIMRRQHDSSLYSYTTPRGVGLKNGWDFLASQVVQANTGLCLWPYTTNGCVEYSNRGGWELAYAYWRTPAYLGPLLLHRPYRWSNWADPGYSTVLFGNLNLAGGA